VGTLAVALRLVVEGHEGDRKGNTYQL